MPFPAEVIGYQSKPVGKQMPFAQFVLEEIDREGAFLHYGWLSEYVSVYPMKRFNPDAVYVHEEVREMADRDDWSFSAGWTLLGYRATIIRGPERYVIKVKGLEALKFLKVLDRLKAEKAARKKAKKEAFKQKELDAAWWP